MKMPQPMFTKTEVDEMRSAKDLGRSLRDARDMRRSEDHRLVVREAQWLLKRSSEGVQMADVSVTLPPYDNPHISVRPYHDRGRGTMLTDDLVERLGWKTLDITDPVVAIARRHVSLAKVVRSLHEVTKVQPGGPEGVLGIAEERRTLAENLSTPSIKVAKQFSFAVPAGRRNGKSSAPGRRASDSYQVSVLLRHAEPIDENPAWASGSITPPYIALTLYTPHVCGVDGYKGALSVKGGRATKSWKCAVCGAKMTAKAMKALGV